MNDQINKAEDAYASGLKIWEMSMQVGGAEQMQRCSIELLNEALALGLDPKKEILCRLTLGLVLFDIYADQFSQVSEAGLDDRKGINEAVATLETALKMDDEKGTSVFVDRTAQSGALLRLNAIWQMQGFYLKNQFGAERKLEYLQEKVRLIKYLGGVKPPNLCISLAFCYRDDFDNRQLTLEWLKNAAEADIYEDIDGESSFFKMAEHSKESGKKGVKEMTTPKGTRTKSSKDDTKSGCFIASSVYGSPFAPEVMIFRKFRDDKLLPSTFGAIFVQAYYFASPSFARIISRLPLLRKVTKRVLLEPNE